VEPLTPQVDFSAIEQNIENEILNSSHDSIEVSSQGSLSDTDSHLVEINAHSDIGTQILERKRLRIFSQITKASTKKDRRQSVGHAPSFGGLNL